MIQVTIQVDDNGNVNVAGPLHQKVWVLAVLRRAVDLVSHYQEPVFPTITFEKPKLKIAESLGDRQAAGRSDSDGKEE